MTQPMSNQQLIPSLLKIRTKRGQIVPLRPNPAQQYYEARRTRRNLILKPRQKGITKWIDGDQLIDCVRKPTNAVVVSHEQKATQRLFMAVKFYIDNMRVKPVITTDNANEIKFPMRGSNYFVGTAGQRAFGRGDTVDRAHLSEAAFYYDLESILAGISEAAEFGQIDIETTANGRGTHFYEMWQLAKAGRSPYTAIFIPWFIDLEYSADSMTQKEIEGLSASVREMFSIPDSEFQFTKEEMQLMERVAKDWNIVLTVGQIKWRRYKIMDKGDLFFQEYPEDDVSCFLQSGRPVFRTVPLNTSYKIDLELLEKLGDELVGKLKKSALVGGVDGAEGTRDGDNHVFAVMNLLEYPGRVIYEYASTEPYEEFDRKVAQICRFFSINLGVEKQGIGAAHISEFRRMGLPHTEWNTTGTSRAVMLSELEQAYRKGELVESYPEAQNEALDMFYDASNRPVHPNNGHDDRVFARAIAYQRSKGPKPGVSWI